MSSIGTLQQQRAFLRRAVGHGSDTALISDELLDDCLAESLREVNLTWPDVGVGTFDTVKDQQVYTGMLAANSYRLRRVFWPQECSVSLPDDVISGVDEYLIDGPGYTFEAAAFLAFQREQEFIRRTFEGYSKNL